MAEHSANRSVTFPVAETKYLTIGNLKEGGLYFGLWFKERCSLAWKTVVEMSVSIQLTSPFLFSPLSHPSE